MGSVARTAGTPARAVLDELNKLTLDVGDGSIFDGHYGPAYRVDSGYAIPADGPSADGYVLPDASGGE